MDMRMPLLVTPPCVDTVNIPGSTSALWQISSITSAAMRLISASNHRLWNTRAQYWQGSVNTICCTGSRGPGSADTVSTVRQPSLRSAGRSDFYTGSRPFLCGNSPVMNSTTVYTPSAWFRTP